MGLNLQAALFVPKEKLESNVNTGLDSNGCPIAKGKFTLSGKLLFS